MTLAYAIPSKPMVRWYPTDTRGWRTWFLIGWPPLALGYACFLDVFDGKWGDPWYRFDWAADLKGTAFYLVGGPLVFAVCVAWCVIAFSLGVWRPTVWSFRRAVFTAIGCLFGAPLMWMAMTLLAAVLRRFFDEAFRY